MVLFLQQSPAYEVYVLCIMTQSFSEQEYAFCCIALGEAVQPQCAYCWPLSLSIKDLSYMAYSWRSSILQSHPYSVMVCTAHHSFTSLVHVHIRWTLKQIFYSCEGFKTTNTSKPKKQTSFVFFFTLLSLETSESLKYKWVGLVCSRFISFRWRSLCH